MTEHGHPEQDRVLELVLGEVGGPERDALTAHLAGCPGCRAEYDALATALEQALAAVPRAAPPPGFEQQVLRRLHGERPPAGERAPARGAVPAGRWRSSLSAAAAAVAGLAAGVGLTLAVTGEEPPPHGSAVAAQGRAVLLTGAGEEVGTVSRSWDRGEPVLVVEVSSGPAGQRYTCRLVLADGQTRDVGAWALDPQRPNSWVVPAPDAVEAVELVGPSGAVWSAADL